MIPIRDTATSRCFPWVNSALIIANLAVFVHQVMLPESTQIPFANLYGTIPARLTVSGWADHHGFPPGGLHTLFTSMFLHGSLLHLIGNMWALWIYGDNVEDRLGHIRYLVFYVFAGALAMLAHVLLNLSSPIPTVGASGAIAGVMGAYMLMFPMTRIVVLIPIIIFPLFVEIPAFAVLIVWIVTQVLGGMDALTHGPQTVGGVAFWAHVGGFFAGMLLCRKIRRRH